MGGKSSSSSSTSSEVSTSTATSTGTVGDVLQGQNITVNDYLSEDVSDVFKQLTALVGQSLDIVGGAGEIISETNKAALANTQDFAKQAVQPDLAVLTKGQNNITYITLGLAGLAVIYFLIRK